MRQFELSVGEPWNFDGPDGQNRIEVEFVGLIAGPEKPNWPSRYALLEVLRPFAWEGQVVERLVAAPRYRGETVEEIVQNGGTVGVLRLRPGVNVGVPGSSRSRMSNTSSSVVSGHSANVLSNKTSAPIWREKREESIPSFDVNAELVSLSLTLEPRTKRS